MKTIRELVTCCSDEANYDFLGGRDLDELMIKIQCHAEVIKLISSGNLCGFISFYCNNFEQGFSFINMLCVDPNSRGKGVAEQLIKMSLEVSKSKGFPSCRLEVSDINYPALNLYRKNGFNKIMVLPTSNLILERKLSSGVKR